MATGKVSTEAERPAIALGIAVVFLRHSLQWPHALTSGLFPGINLTKKRIRMTARAAGRSRLQTDCRLSNCSLAVSPGGLFTPYTMLR